MKTILNQSKYGAMLLVFALLGSCRVSKDVKAPDLDLPASYGSVAAAADTASIANVSWRSFFADKELDDLIADALTKNNDLQVAVKNIEAADQTLRQAKLGNVPVVGLAATASTSRPSDNSLNGLTLNEALTTKHVEDYTIGASLSWEADIWGKISSAKSAALASYLGTIEARKAVQTRLVSDVAKGYYNLLLLDTKLNVAQKNLQLDDSTLTLINFQYKAGQVTSLAVQQATAQKLEAAGLIQQFEQAIAIQENALSILSGRLPSKIARERKLDNVPVSDSLKAGVPSQLLANRPDVRQAELALQQANANVGYAKASMYPSLTITAQGGLDAFKAGNWFNIPASLFGAVAGGITQPLLNQRKLKTQYEVAKINREQTVFRFRQSVLVGVEDVSDALISIQKLKEQRSLASARTNVLQVAIRNSQMLFNNGMATYLEVITAQSNVLQSELELADIKKSQLDAEVDLYRSVGGGSL